MDCFLWRLFILLGHLVVVLCLFLELLRDLGLVINFEE